MFVDEQFEKEINDFMEKLLSRENIGDFISFSDIKQKFQIYYRKDIKKCDVDEWNSNFNKYKKLIKNSNGYIVYPFKKEIEGFYAKIFFQHRQLHTNTYCNIFELKELKEEFEKEFNLKFYKSDFNSWLKKICKKQDDLIIRIQDNKYINISKVFIYNYFDDVFFKNDFSVIYRSDLNNNFYTRFKIQFEDYFFDLWRNTLHYDKKFKIREIGEQYYVNNKIMIDYLGSILSSTSSVEEIKSLFFKKFNIIIDDVSFDIWLNSIYPEYSSVEHYFEHSRQEFYNSLVNKISEEFRRIFLPEKLGFRLQKEDFRILLKQKYDITINDFELLSDALENANSILLDIKIFEENDFYYSCIQGTTVNDKEDMRCPVCNIIISPNQVKDHIITEHISYQENHSVIRREGDCFYCNHCYSKRKQIIDCLNKQLSYNFLMFHISGDCMSECFLDKHEQLSRYFRTESDQSIDKRIWNGTAYSNLSNVLGNSGQILRDQGKFGSFPNEDYYGDGDKEW